MVRIELIDFIGKININVYNPIKGIISKRNNALFLNICLILGATMLVVGLIELQKNSKEFWGYFGIVASLFAFYVAIQGILFALTWALMN